MGQNTQECDLNLIKRLAPIGEAVSFCYKDNYVFVGSTYGPINVIDVSDPTDIKYVSQTIMQNTVFALAVHNNILLAGLDTRGLELIDISDIKNPRKISSYFERGTTITSISVEENIIYCTTYNSLFILDYTDPYNLTEIGNINFESYFDFIDQPKIIKLGKICYVGISYSILEIDVENKKVPKLLNAFTINDKITSFYVAKDIYYIIHTNYDSSLSHFSIFDNSSHSTPILLSDISKNKYIVEFRNIVVDQNKAIITVNRDDRSKVLIYSIESLNSPKEISSLSVVDSKIISKGQQLNNIYLVGSNGLSIISTNNINSPKILDLYNPGSLFTSIAVNENFILATSEVTGLAIFENANYDSLKLISHYKNIDKMKNVFVKDKYAFVTSKKIFEILDLSDIENPLLISSTKLQDGYESIIVDSLAYIADGDYGIKIFNISDILDPKLVSQFNNGININCLDIYNNNIFTGGRKNFQILEINHQNNITQISNIGGIYSGHDIKVLDDLACIANEENGVIFNIADLANPKFKSIYYGPAYGVDLFNNYAVVADLFGGIKIIDLTIPENPKINCSYSHNDLSMCVQVYDNKIFSALYNTGICILERNLLSDTNVVNNNDYDYVFMLFQNYPNPFNQNTTISYTIPKQLQVTLKVYDMLGREIKTLVNKIQLSGNYKVKFDGSNLGSGIYYYKIQTSEFTETKKLMLLK
ncbi:MAG: T9SS type A sorting domain-containing protein [Ignavibacteriae bacterium]|nr:T9SS type A sorting domain-containing protein [Ignavibacteriota bacterium]